MKTLVARKATWIAFILLTHYLQACLLPLITFFFNFKVCSLEVYFNNSNKVWSKIFAWYLDRTSIFLSISLQRVIKVFSGKGKGCSCWSWWWLHPDLLNLSSLTVDTAWESYDRARMCVTYRRSQQISSHAQISLCRDMHSYIHQVFGQAFMLSFTNTINNQTQILLLICM